MAENHIDNIVNKSAEEIKSFLLNETRDFDCWDDIAFLSSKTPDEVEGEDKKAITYEQVIGPFHFIRDPPIKATYFCRKGLYLDAAVHIRDLNEPRAIFLPDGLFIFGTIEYYDGEGRIPVWETKQEDMVNYTMFGSAAIQKMQKLQASAASRKND